MSRFKIEQKTSECGTGGADDLARLVTLSLEGASEFMKQSSSFFLAALPKLASSGGATCCDIPETSCPPRCTRTIEWEGSAGEELRTVIKVVNTSKAALAFTFSSNPFTNAAGLQLPVEVSPASATLNPGASATVLASFTVTDAVALGGPLEEAEVLIQGAYTQRVCLKLQAQANKAAHCVVEQGDPPVRIRAHEWWDHFQCTEPCVTDVTVAPPPTVGTVNLPTVGRAKPRNRKRS
jgi:hypothetical protein